MVGKLVAHLRQQWMGAFALFLVLTGGSAYALAGHNTVLSDDVVNNQLKSADLKNGKAVRGIDVKNGSMGTSEFAGSIPAVGVTRASVQSIPSDAPTPLAFNAERHDTAAMHSTGLGADTSRLRAPVSGIYAVNAQIQWEGDLAGFRHLTLWRNGSTIITQAEGMASTGVIPFPQEVTTQARLEAGDFVQALVDHNNGVPLDILRFDEYTPEFSMTWLAPGP
jgi:hypothetical protein